MILEPDRDEPYWWAGAPSVVQGRDGRFYLAARMREATSPRGYEIRLLESDDGRSFSPIGAVRRGELEAPSCFERPALVVDPHSGHFRLYICGPTEPDSNLWGIFLFDEVEDLRALDRASVRLVLPPSATSAKPNEQRTGYKDPLVLHAAGQWHMFVTGYDLVERVCHFLSDDGRRWRADPSNPVLDSGGWHNFFTRPASVLPGPVGYTFIYEGSSSAWYDPGYNIATGIGVTLDLFTITDLTPGAPVLRSTTPGDYHTWRYSDWLAVEDRIHVYAEVARPNNTNEIRLFTLPRG